MQPASLRAHVVLRLPQQTLKVGAKRTPLIEWTLVLSTKILFPLITLK